MAQKTRHIKLLSEIEHVLKRPNIYIGSVKQITEKRFILDEDDSGNDGKMQRRISEGLDVEINITGNELSGSGVFDSLIDLRDALENNDEAAIADLITDLDTAADNVLGLESRNGLVKSRMQMTSTRLETAKTNILSFLSETEDADLAEVIMEYNSEEMAYKAALQTTTKALQLIIMDFIR